MEFRAEGAGIGRSPQRGQGLGRFLKIDGLSVVADHQLAGSGWFAGQCIRGLCSKFEDPIEEVSRTDDGFVIITLKFPSDSEVKGRIVIGPRGTGTFVLEDGGESMNSETEDGWLLVYWIEDELEEAGLCRRMEDPEPGPRELTEGS